MQTFTAVSDTSLDFTFTYGNYTKLTRIYVPGNEDPWFLIDQVNGALKSNFNRDELLSKIDNKNFIALLELPAISKLDLQIQADRSAYKLITAYNNRTKFTLVSIPAAIELTYKVSTEFNKKFRDWIFHYLFMLYNRQCTL